jgi:hypothetical protein
MAAHGGKKWRKKWHMAEVVQRYAAAGPPRRDYELQLARSSIRDQMYSNLASD